MITNATSGTNLHEIAPGIYRINTPIRIPGAPDILLRISSAPSGTRAIRSRASVSSSPLAA
jgi:hypothetical protein